MLPARILLQAMLVFVFLHAGLPVDASTKDTAFIAGELRKSKSLLDQLPDSALVHANLAFQSALSTGNDTLMGSALFLIGQSYNRCGNAKLALDYLFRSLSLVEKDVHGSSYPLRQMNLIRLLNEISSCYFDLKMIDLALQYSEKTISVIEESNRRKPGTIKPFVRMVVLYNTGSLYLNKEDYIKSKKYFREVEKLNATLHDSSTMAGLLSNEGNILKANGEYEKANESFMKSKEIWEKLGSCKGYVSVYNNLGENFLLQKKYTDAIYWLRLVVDKGTECGAMRSVQIATEKLSDIYKQTGNLSEAIKRQELYLKLSDSIFNNENVANLGKLAIQYDFDKQIHEQELEQREALKDQRQKQLFFIMLASVFFLLCLIIGLLFINQRRKTQNERLKRDQLDLERRNLKLEKEKLELDLDYKNKELATNVMYLVQQNEYLSEIAGKLLEMKNEDTDGRQQMDRLVAELKSKKDDRIWKEFELRFQDVHQDFYRRLNERFPDLTPNEKKLAAFLRLNMTSKDISAITFQTTESIKIARSRLRKKLGISQEENLIAFLEGV